MEKSDLITSIGTTALVSLEDSAPSILWEKFPRSDFQIWPLLRWLVARSMAEVELNTRAVPRTFTTQQKIKRTLKRLLPDPYAPSRIRTKAEFLFIVTGNTVSPQPNGVKNWLVDDHAAALGNRALVLQDRGIDRSGPAHSLPTLARTFSFEDSVIRAELAARFRPPRKADLAFSHEVVQEVFRHLEFDVDQARVSEAGRRLDQRLYRARHTARLLERVLDRVQPKIVFMQSASYGDRSHLISTMASRGITVVEHQHGWIGPSHGAYNFGKAMWAPELSRCLPEILLTYGDFWSDHVRTPSTLVAVGKPHLEIMAQGSQPRSSRAKEVAVISSMFEPEETARFTLAVRDALPKDWTVLFRPHPSERAAMGERFPTLLDQNRIVIDETPDVFETLNRVRGVVGYASTVLYEALAMKCAVFVKDSPLADLYMAKTVFGDRITDDASLRRAMKSLTNGEGELTEDDLESIWKSDSNGQFLRFVSELREK